MLKRADVLGCFDRETLISQIAVYPLKANIYDSVYPIGFVTSVCTYPEYTGRGIMKRLMYQALVHMRERKQPFGMLFPYSIPLYRASAGKSSPTKSPSPSRTGKSHPRQKRPAMSAVSTGRTRIL